MQSGKYSPTEEYKLLSHYKPILWPLGWPVRLLFCKLHWLPICFNSRCQLSPLKALCDIGPGYQRSHLTPMGLVCPNQISRKGMIPLVKEFWLTGSRRKPFLPWLLPSGTCSPRQSSPHHFGLPKGPDSLDLPIGLVPQ